MRISGEGSAAKIAPPVTRSGGRDRDGEGAELKVVRWRPAFVFWPSGNALDQRGDVAIAHVECRFAHPGNDRSGPIPGGEGDRETGLGQIAPVLARSRKQTGPLNAVLSRSLTDSRWLPAPAESAAALASVVTRSDMGGRNADVKISSGAGGRGSLLVRATGAIERVIGRAGEHPFRQLADLAVERLHRHGS